MWLRLYCQWVVGLLIDKYIIPAVTGDININMYTNSTMSICASNICNNSLGCQEEHRQAE